MSDIQGFFYRDIWKRLARIVSRDVQDWNESTYLMM